MQASTPVLPLTAPLEEPEEVVSTESAPAVTRPPQLRQMPEAVLWSAGARSGPAGSRSFWQPGRVASQTRVARCPLNHPRD